MKIQKTSEKYHVMGRYLQPTTGIHTPRRIKASGVFYVSSGQLVGKNKKRQSQSPAHILKYIKLS